MVTTGTACCNLCDSEHPHRLLVWGKATCLIFLMERDCDCSEVRLVPLCGVCGGTSRYVVQTVGCQSPWWSGFIKHQLSDKIRTRLSNVYGISHYTSVTVCGDLTSYSLVGRYERFGMTCCLPFKVEHSRVNWLCDVLQSVVLCTCCVHLLPVICSVLPWRWFFLQCAVKCLQCAVKYFVSCRSS